MTNTITTNEKIVDKIYEALSEGIKREAEEIFTRAKEEAVAELDRKKDEIVASISIKIMEHVAMQRMGNDLVITVSTEKLKV